ncbi:MAG: ExbD/TolR family protein [Kiritimatiellia bacterium]
MGRKTDLLQNQMIGEINLTPLMDLTFILLITFIITFPLLESGLPVSLPKAAGTPIEDQDTVTVTVNAQGSWFFDKRAVNREQFVSELKYLKASRPDAVILLRGDEGLAYGRLIEVMQVLKENGIQKISLVTQTGESSGGA